jgi:hypothetical protein
VIDIERIKDKELRDLWKTYYPWVGTQRGRLKKF